MFGFSMSFRKGASSAQSSPQSLTTSTQTSAVVQAPAGQTSKVHEEKNYVYLDTRAWLVLVFGGYVVARFIRASFVDEVPKHIDMPLVTSGSYAFSVLCYAIVIVTAWMIASRYERSRKRSKALYDIYAHEVVSQGVAWQNGTITEPTHVFERSVGMMIELIDERLVDPNELFKVYGGCLNVDIGVLVAVDAFIRRGREGWLVTERLPKWKLELITLAQQADLAGKRQAAEAKRVAMLAAPAVPAPTPANGVSAPASAVATP